MDNKKEFMKELQILSKNMYDLEIQVDTKQKLDYETWLDILKTINAKFTDGFNIIKNI